MKRIFVPLETDERQALINLARLEKRDPRQQAALMLRQMLEQQGLLQPTNLEHSVTRGVPNDDC